MNASLVSREFCKAAKRDKNPSLLSNLSSLLIHFTKLIDKRLNRLEIYLSWSPDYLTLSCNVSSIVRMKGW